jgi:hypothetical protein
MTDARSKATVILFDLVTTLEPRLCGLKQWYKTIVQTTEKWQQSEGNQGVKRMKDILSKGWLTILGEQTDPMPFVKAKDGLPDLVRPLVEKVKRCHYDARLLSAVLTLVRVTDLWEGTPDEATIRNQLQIIEGSRLPKKARKVISEFEDFVKKFIESNPNHPVCKAWKQAIRVTNRSEMRDINLPYYSRKSGPNGPLTEMAHRDYVTVKSCKTANGDPLGDAILHLGQLICEQASPGESLSSTEQWGDSGDDLISRSKSWSKPPATCPGKVTPILEKAGKVRLVASPDYFSQATMRPLHSWLMRVLSQFPADCTYDQRSAVGKIQTWQKEPGRSIYSFDQSSCTDLFPIDCQLILLEQRFGKPFASAVRTVMVDRDWKVTLPKSGQSMKVRWSVGQPMGIYASWPLMALTHHFLVQFSSWKARGRKIPVIPFDKYVICGDDVVIASKTVADCYHRVVTDLGMKINLAKSHISGGKTGVPPVSEFAKITVWKGQPLFPIRPNMVLSSVKDWRQAVPLLVDLANVDGWRARLRFLQTFIKRAYPTKQRFLVPLLTIPLELGGVGFRDHEPLSKKFDKLDAMEIHPWLYFLASKIRSQIVLEDTEIDIPMGTIIDEAGADLMRSHPLYYYANNVRNSRSTALDLLRSKQDLRVPDIALQILGMGFGPYTRFLTGSTNVSPVPNWANEDKEQQANRRLWEKALSGRHRFPKGSSALVHKQPGGNLVVNALTDPHLLASQTERRIVHALSAIGLEGRVGLTSK